MAAKRWISPSFEDLPKDKATEQLSRNRKRKQNDRGTRKNIIETKMFQKTTWLETFAPKNKQDLAVNKKKVEQVEIWLCNYFQMVAKKIKNQSPILLLTGPSGVGKTATINVLAHEHNIEIREWENPNDIVDEWKIGGPENVNQSTSFNNFLFKASRYGSVLNEPKFSNKMLLVEEVPNSFYRDSSNFWAILRKYQASILCPLVFVVSETGCTGSSETNLFPKEFLEQLQVSVINFNPITTLSITKTLNLILTEVKKINTGIHNPSKNEIDKLALTCNGDIRSAILSLQFGLAGSKKSDKQACLNSLGGKNSPLDLFHSLGKILYCKRDMTKTEPKLPQKLEKMKRFPTIEDPEEVFQRTLISEEGFNLFLFANYLDFMVDCDRMANCASAFSEVDSLLSEWSIRDDLKKYNSSIAIRSLMFNLNLPNDSVKKEKFHKFQKPRWFAVKMLLNKQTNNVQSQFQIEHVSMGRDLETVYIPYVAIIKPSNLGIPEKVLAENLNSVGKKASFSAYNELQSKPNFENSNLPSTSTYRLALTDDEKNELEIEEVQSE